MENEHTRCLIEDSLFLKAISNQSAREQSIHYSHISNPHLYWARQPLAVTHAPTKDWQQRPNPCYAAIQPVVDLRVQESVLQFNPQGKVGVEE